MPQNARGWGSLNGVCREEVRFSITQLHKIKVITINFIFSVSVLLHLLMIFKKKSKFQQECIPVGCVPPAAVAVGRRWGLPQCMLGYTSQVWAWRPPPTRPLNLSHGCGPGDPPCQTRQPPPWLWAWRPPLETCKACWDTPLPPRGQNDRHV